MTDKPGVDGTSFKVTTPNNDPRRPIVYRSVGGHNEEEMHWETMTEEQREQVSSLCAGEINKQIRDWKECGALKNAKGISDGYHTFGELYEFRAALTIALFKKICWRINIKDYPQGQPEKVVWRSRLHSDGSMFEGMFILGLGTESGKQITFHYHLDKWDACDFAETLDKAPEWDGHTPADVLERLKQL